MKLFRIFAVGLILSAVVISTAVAPMSSAAGTVIDPNLVFDAAAFQAYQPALDALEELNLGSTESAGSINMGVTQVTNNLSIRSTSLRALGDYEFELTKGMAQVVLPADTGPTSNPPEADVVPNFSGLNVEGITEIDSNADGDIDFSVNDEGNVIINSGIIIDANNDGDPEFSTYTFPGTNINLSYLGNIDPARAHVLVENLFGDILLYAPNIIAIRATNGLILDSTDVDIDGDLDVNGDINTTGNIGSFYRRAYTTSNAQTSTSVFCYAGDSLTGCSGKAVNNWPIQGTIGTLNHCYVYASGTAKKLEVIASCFDPSGEHVGALIYDPSNPNQYP